MRNRPLKLFGNRPTRSAVPQAPTVPEPTPRPPRHPLEGVGPVALDGEMELRNRAFLLSKTQRIAFCAALFIPPLAPLVLAISGPDQLREPLLQVLLPLLSLCLATVFAIFTLLGQSRQRLFIGPGGLRYYGGSPSWLGPLCRNWSVSADQIRDIRVSYPTRGTTPSFLQLVVETEGERRRLSVFQWVDVKRYDREAFRALGSLWPDQNAVASLFDALPLVAYARASGYALTLPDERKCDEIRLSLKGKPRVAAALTLALLGATYAAIDMGVVSETYAAGAPVWILLAGGCSAGLLTWWLLRGGEASRRTRAIVAILVALAAVAALYPGLIRVNRIGAADPQPYRYRHSEQGLLEPVDPASPELDLPEIVELLAGSRPGDVHELWIRRGWLGFDQVDMDALEEWIRELEAPASEP